MRECDAAMRCACMRQCDAECHVTRRYGTERKNHQDRGEKSSVPDAVGAVDKADPRVRLFLDLDAAGWAAHAIAKEVGVSERTITRWRHTTDRNKAAPSVRRPQTDRVRAEMLLDDGASFEETAATLGVSKNTIRRWFPNRPAWTRSQSAQWAISIRRINQLLERNAA